MNVRLTEAQKIRILNSDDIFSIMQMVLRRENKIDRDKEHFWIIGLATNNKVLFIELVSLGSVSQTIVEPMNVFRVAILKNASKVILVHNHPSGALTPSEGDKDITDRLIQVGLIISVEVIEHLIITPSSYLSFVDIGLFAKLKESLQYVPPYKIAETIRKEEQKLRKEAIQIAEKKGLEEGRKKEKIEMAKAMKADGESSERIIKYTQLSLQEIEKL